MSNLADQYGEYFNAFKSAIDNFVKIVKEFAKTIKTFVDGFQKNITAGDEFKDTDEN